MKKKAKIKEERKIKTDEKTIMNKEKERKG